MCARRRLCSPSQVDVAGQADNQYSIPSPQPRARHTVQIRVRDVRSGPWSSWSQPVEFGRRRVREHAEGRGAAGTVLVGTEDLVCRRAGEP